MKTKSIRILLADAREEKQAVESTKLKVDWQESAFLVSPNLMRNLKQYFEQSKDGFALRRCSESNAWFLFDVRLVESPNNNLSLAIVLQSQKQRFLAPGLKRGLVAA